ncbi:hypothetical protein FF1_004366 [Malus domestica]
MGAGIYSQKGPVLKERCEAQLAGPNKQQLGLSRTHSPATSYLNHSHRCRATSSVSLRFCHGNRKVKTKASNADNQGVKLEEKIEEEEEEEFQVLTAMKAVSTTL